MMKKSVLNYLRFFFLVLFIVGFTSTHFAVPVMAASGQTLGDLKNQLKELQNKYSTQQNKKKQTEAERNANIKKKNQAEDELEDTKAKITSLTEEIEKTNQDIDTVKAESEELLRLYQQLESDNIYLSYITGASTITDMIMRMDAVSQLTKANQSKLDELELLIKSNEKLSKELDKYEGELGDKIIAYEASVDALNGEIEELEEGTVSLDKQISSLKQSIKSYEDLGCKDNELLTVCLNGDINNSGWLRPVSKAKITSLYGKRKSPTAGASSNHKGIDMGVAEGTKVYATAAGTVGAIVRKSSCGGNMVYIWAYVNGKPYTYVFMHLLEIKVSVGQVVTTNDVVALSGGGKSTASKYGGYDRCTTGAHLHYGLASGGFYNSSNFNSHTINPPGYPGLYQWFYTR